MGGWTVRSIRGEGDRWADQTDTQTDKQARHKKKIPGATFRRRLIWTVRWQLDRRARTGFSKKKTGPGFPRRSNTGHGFRLSSLSRPLNTVCSLSVSTQPACFLRDGPVVAAISISSAAGPSERYMCIICAWLQDGATALQEGADCRTRSRQNLQLPPCNNCQLQLRQWIPVGRSGGDRAPAARPGGPGPASLGPCWLSASTGRSGLCGHRVGLGFIFGAPSIHHRTCFPFLPCSRRCVSGCFWTPRTSLSGRRVHTEHTCLAVCGPQSITALRYPVPRVCIRPAVVCDPAHQHQTVRCRPQDCSKKQPGQGSAHVNLGSARGPLGRSHEAKILWGKLRF